MADFLEGVDNKENSLLDKHRKERKDLQASIQSLKKSASKGDKKKRKEVLEEIARLEIDLDRKQSEELNKLNNAKSIQAADIDPPENHQHRNVTDSDSPKSDEIPDTEPATGQRVSKAQKRRDKKAKEERNKEAEIQAQEEINKNGPRTIELQKIRKILTERGLTLHSIQSDGDCLYNAVIHQLKIIGRELHDVRYLRNKTANYILDNKDTLICYMTNPDTGDLLSDDEFSKYCDTIRNTPTWGGQIEIKALSNILKVPIEVLQATAPPTVQGDDEYPGPPLVLTYHRLMYSLGEHYNSTKPRLTTADGDNDDEEDVVALSEETTAEPSAIS